MPIEFLHGRTLLPEELEEIRRTVEAMDGATAVAPEIRAIVARNWPELLKKLPPVDD
jgi:hypothetical protein